MPVDENLNREFRLWLGRFALHWAVPFDKVPPYLGRVEVANRQQHYPALAKALLARPLAMDRLSPAIRECWALQEQFDSIRLTEFLGAEESPQAIVALLDDFPASVVGASERIEAFLTSCGTLGYSDPKSGRLNQSSAALLASVLLTAVFPTRFVDFRQTRWKGLAEELEYPLFMADKPTYGQMLIEAGQFARAITETETFKKCWPTGEPLWSIAGVSWAGNSDRGLDRPKGIEGEDITYEEEFEEGQQRLRQHFIRERSTSIVRAAKELWRSADPLLRCDVCGFSFTEAYGEMGKDYIEAHHTTPVSKLRAGERTKVKDLAKVCANCHRMLHIGTDCLTIAQLRDRLKR